MARERAFLLAYLDELALGFPDLRRGFYVPTGRAYRAGVQDTAVCAGLGQFLGLWLVAFTLRLFPIVKNVVVNVGHQTQTQRISGMVEDDTCFGPRINPKAPAYLLDVQHLGTCGGSVDNAAHGPVYPRGQLPDRTGNLDFARPEIPFQLGHFHAVSLAIHIPRRNTRSLKLSL